MEEKRKYHRSPTKQNCQYFLDDKEKDFGGCTITDVSRGGMGIRFNTVRNITIGSNIRLKIPPRSLATFIKLRGILRWIKEKENYLTAGIKITGLK